MGWAVNCHGADLVGMLRADEESVLGRMYGLYIVALATEIDDEAITWLYEYGRAIDSLTGEAIAFLVFYNGAHFYAHANTLSAERRTVVDLAGSARVFRRALPEIEVPGKALNSSCSLTEHIRGGNRFPDEAFVTAMTYESDQMARVLGIRPNELPCLVFIDDPGSLDYYLVPMDCKDKDLISKLREIVGEYYSRKSHQEWFALIRHWDSLEKTARDLRRERLKLEEMIRAKGEEVPSEPPMFADLPYSQLPAALENLGRWMAAVYGVVIPPELKREVDVVTGWIGYVRRLARAEGKVQYFLEALDRGPLDPADRIKLERLHRKTLEGLIPHRPGGWLDDGPEVIREALNLAVARSNPDTVEVERRLARLQELINAIPLAEIRKSRVARMTSSLAAIDAKLAELERLIDLVREQAMALPRPRVEPILMRLKWGERRRTAASAAATAATGVGKRLESILKLIDLGLKATGHS
jgi:hypothetical protein